MAITDKEGTQLKVTEQGVPARSVLPPVVEPAKEPRYDASQSMRANIDPMLETFARGRAPGYFENHQQAPFPRARVQRFGQSDSAKVAYNQFYKESMYSSEIFFSSYLMDLIQVVRSKSGNEEHEKDALEQAVLLLQGLRDLAQDQTTLHYRSIHPLVVDPFFPAPALPGLKVVVSGEVEAKDIVTDISLAEYLQRLVQNRTRSVLSHYLMTYEGGDPIRVVITSDKNYEGHHVVVIPQPEELLAAIINGELKIN